MIPQNSHRQTGIQFSQDLSPQPCPSQRSIALSFPTALAWAGLRALSSIRFYALALAGARRFIARIGFALSLGLLTTVLSSPSWAESGAAPNSASKSRFHKSIKIPLSLDNPASPSEAADPTPEATDPYSEPSTLCEDFYIQPRERLKIPFSGEEVQAHGEVPPGYWFQYYNQVRQNQTGQYATLYSFRVAGGRNSPVYVALVDEGQWHQDHRLQAPKYCHVIWGPEPAHWD